MTSFIRRHRVASYFVLAISISWGGILAIVLPGSIPASLADAERLFLPVYLAMLAGPSIAGLAITAATEGRSGLHDYWRRLIAWRVGSRWYAVALLAAPAAVAVTVLALSQLSTEFLPAILWGDPATAGLLTVGSIPTFVFTGLAVGIGAGFFEELGWSGVAVPRMLERRSLMSTGVIVGIVWGAWHFLAMYWGSASAVESVPVVIYLLVALFSFLVPYRILMTWVYRHTRSTFIAVLMHASLTSSMLVLGPAVSGWKLLAYDLAFGLVLWVGAAAALATASEYKVRGERRIVLPAS